MSITFEKQAQIFYPTSRKDLIEIIKNSAAGNIKVTVIGAKTSLRSKPAINEIRNFVSLERMPAKIELLATDLTVIVPAQKKAAELNDFLEEHNLFLPMDIANPGAVTIGAMAATNARCLRTACYGPLRNYILGMDIIDSQGQIMRPGGMTVKNVAGYDLAQFLVGSQGEMAIITHLIFKLLPLPEKRITLQVRFDSDAQAIRAMKAVSDNLLLPARLEWISHLTRQRLDASCRPKSMVLIEIDGLSVILPERISVYGAICRQCQGWVQQINNPGEQALVWAERRTIFQKIIDSQSPFILVTIEIPPSRESNLLNLAKIVAVTESSYLFGHGLDGVWHVVFTLDPEDLALAGNRQDYPRSLRKVRTTIRRLAAEGKIRQEIGHGFAYRPLTARSVSEVEQALRRQIKLAFDPNDLFRRL